MKDLTSWSVRELKRYLQTNGVPTRSYKQKTELIQLATKLMYEEEQAEWIRNGITLAVIALSVLLLNVYIRPKIEKLFWLNPKWVISYIVLHLIGFMEILLTIDMILSWILPSTLAEYNLIHKYLIKPLQLFPLSVPLTFNFDSQAQHASEPAMWINLYPMLLMYLLRRLKEYVMNHYNYTWYNQYRATYYQQISHNQMDINELQMRDMIQVLPNESESDSESERTSANDNAYEYERNGHENIIQNEDDLDEELQRALFQSMQDQ